jgi:hypothetical protein
MKLATWIGSTRARSCSPLAFTPSREPPSRLIVGALGIPVADVGREEFPETFRGLRLLQEQRGWPGGDGRQMPSIHLQAAGRFVRLRQPIVDKHLRIAS